MLNFTQCVYCVVKMRTITILSKFLKKKTNKKNINCNLMCNVYSYNFTFE